VHDTSDHHNPISSAGSQGGGGITILPHIHGTGTGIATHHHHHHVTIIHSSAQHITITTTNNITHHHHHHTSTSHITIHTHHT